MKKIFILFFITFIAFGFENFAQQNVKVKKSEFKLKKEGSSKALQNIRYGDFYYEQFTQGTYQKALEYYLQAQNYNPNNAELNYKIGVSFIESINRTKSLEYFSKAFELKNDVSTDILFYLGWANQLNYKFDNAIENYNKYLETIKGNGYLESITQKKIFECKNGKVFIENKQKIIITNLTTINSEHKDYGSLITVDGSKMFFTSRRPNTTGEIDVKDNQHYEDIYSSKKDSLGWKSPVNVKSLNTPGHDAVVGLSPDGNILILYYSGDLFFSELNGENWSSPKQFPKEINSKDVETSACFSLDGNTLFFVRGKTADPKTSNADIYYSTKNEQGNWTEAKALPSSINTPYDEDGLFMFADGKTLYFSSKGHNSMGGYDIFYTYWNEDETFEKPTNLGYPINSPDDDIYFVLEANKVTGYYTAFHDDSQGFTEIYQITFMDRNIILDSEDNLIASIADPISEINLEKKEVAVIKGKIFDENGNPIDAEITIIDNNTNQIIYKTRSNSQDGEYIINIPVGKNYGMVINKEGYLFLSENFDLVATSEYQEITKDVKMNTIQVNTTATLNNIFFDFGSSNLKTTSEPELDRVVTFLNENSNITIEISGHTDNIGTQEDNIILSQKRAQLVADYIITKNIDANRIKVVGYGFAVPVASNETAEGRNKNRRVEFKILTN